MNITAEEEEFPKYRTISKTKPSPRLPQRPRRQGGFSSRTLQLFERGEKTTIFPFFFAARSFPFFFSFSAPTLLLFDLSFFLSSIGGPRSRFSPTTPALWSTCPSHSRTLSLSSLILECPICSLLFISQGQISLLTR